MYTANCVNSRPCSNGRYKYMSENTAKLVMRLLQPTVGSIRREKQEFAVCGGCTSHVAACAVQRFRRRTEEVNEDDSDWAALEDGGSSEDDVDDSFKPEYAFWADKGALKGKGTRGPRPRGTGPGALNRQRARQQVGSCSQA